MEILGVVVLIIMAILFVSRNAEGSTGKAAAAQSRPFPTRFDDLIQKYASENGLRFELLKGMIRDESNFDPNAWNDERKKGDSSDDAIGLMQVRQGALTDYNREHGTNLMMDALKEPRVAIMVGAWYVAQFINEYGEEVGLEMYNVGEAGYNSGTRNPQYVAKIQKFASNYA
jgi:soluble lytic murein transglycosylase-like protein